MAGTNFDLFGALGNGINSAIKGTEGFLGSFGNEQANAEKAGAVPPKQTFNSKTGYYEPSKPSVGLLPSKTTPQGSPQVDVMSLHQQKINADKKLADSTGAALKTGNALVDGSNSQTPTIPPATLTPQEQFDQNQANGKDIHGNSVPPPQTQNQQAVSGLLTQANQSPAYTAAQANASAAQQKAQALEDQESQGVMNLGREPMTAGDFMGQSGTLISGLNSKIGNALTGVTQAQKAVDQATAEQGAQTTAGNAAASQTSPIAAAPIMNPQTGQLINPGLVQQAMSAVQQAVANGTDINNDPNIQKIANSMGFLGSTAVLDMANKMGVSTTAQSAASQQNVATGQAFQNQGAVLQATLTGMDGYNKQLQKIMGLSGANPFSTPIANQTYANYFTNVNPSAKDSIAAYMAEIKNSASQIIASSTGVNPTDVASMLNSYDFTQLTPKQLNEFMQNVDAAGQTKLSTYQQGKTASYGGNIGYSGNTANPNPTVNGGTPNSPLVAGAATGANAVSGLFNDVMNALGANATNAITGGAGGIATIMFGL